MEGDKESNQLTTNQKVLVEFQKLAKAKSLANMIVTIKSSQQDVNLLIIYTGLTLKLEPKKRAQSFEERQQDNHGHQKNQGYNQEELESDEEYNSEDDEGQQERIYQKLNQEAGMDYDEENMQYYENEEEYIRALQKQAGGRYGQQNIHGPIAEDADENASDYQKVQEEIDSYGQGKIFTATLLILSINS